MSKEVIGYFVEFLTPGGSVTMGPHPLPDILEIKKKFAATQKAGQQMFLANNQMGGELWQSLEIDPRAVFGIKIYREPPNPNKKMEELLDKLSKDMEGDEPWKNS